MRTQKPQLPSLEGQGPTRQDSPLIHASRLSELPKPEWLIEGQIPRRGLGGDYGHPGSGKTFKTLDQLLTIAQKHPVVYVPSEGLHNLDNRLKALCDYRGLGLGEFYVYETAVQVAQPESIKTFIRDVRSVECVIVALDTLSGSFVGFDENAPKDMGLFINGCKNIGGELDCFVQVNHHMPRNGRFERGHTSFRGACDVMFEVSKKGSIVTVTCTKSKDSEPFPTQKYKLVPHLNSLVLTSEIAPGTDELAVLKTIAAHPGIKAIELIDTVSVSKATVYRVLSKLKDKSWVLDSDGCYQVSTQGLKIPGISAVSNAPETKKPLELVTPERESHAPEPTTKLQKFRAGNGLGENQSQVSRNGFQCSETETIPESHRFSPLKGETETRSENRRP